MFIETYYDERVPVPATPREPTIPYPELSGEELTASPLSTPAADTIRARIVGQLPAPPMRPLPDPITRQSGPALK